MIPEDEFMNNYPKSLGFEKLRVTFNGPMHKVEINFEALFPAFDYGTSGEARLPARSSSPHSTTMPYEALQKYVDIGYTSYV